MVRIVSEGLFCRSKIIRNHRKPRLSTTGQYLKRPSMTSWLGPVLRLLCWLLTTAWRKVTADCQYRGKVLAKDQLQEVLFVIRDDMGWSSPQFLRRLFDCGALYKWESNMLRLGPHTTEAPVIWSKVVVCKNVLRLGVRRAWRDGGVLSWTNLRCRRSWHTRTHTHTWRGSTGVSQSHSFVKIWLQQSSCQLEATVSGSKVPPLMDSSGIQDMLMISPRHSFCPIQWYLQPANRFWSEIWLKKCCLYTFRNM